MWFHKQWPELCLKTSLYHVMEIKRENGSHCRMCTRGKILILFTQLHLQFTNKIFGWRVIEKCSFKDLYSFIPLHTHQITLFLHLGAWGGGALQSEGKEERDTDRQTGRQTRIHRDMRRESWNCLSTYFFKFPRYFIHPFHMTYHSLLY